MHLFKGTRIRCHICCQEAVQVMTTSAGKEWNHEFNLDSSYGAYGPFPLLSFCISVYRVGLRTYMVFTYSGFCFPGIWMEVMYCSWEASIRIYRMNTHSCSTNTILDAWGTCLWTARYCVEQAEFTKYTVHFQQACLWSLMNRLDEYISILYPFIFYFAWWGFM